MGQSSPLHLLVEVTSCQSLSCYPSCLQSLHSHSHHSLAPWKQQPLALQQHIISPSHASSHHIKSKSGPHWPLWSCAKVERGWWGKKEKQAASEPTEHQMSLMMLSMLSVRQGLAVEKKTWETLIYINIILAKFWLSTCLYQSYHWQTQHNLEITDIKKQMKLYI